VPRLRIRGAIPPRAVIARSVQRWVTGWTIGVLRFDSRREQGIFFFTAASRTSLGPTQPIQWVAEALSLAVKRLGCEADHSPPSSAEVKNACSYTSAPQYVFMAWCLVKQRDYFTLFCAQLSRGTTLPFYLGVIPPLPMRLHGVMLIKHKGNF
jgi:hypothetical protein